MSSSEILQSHHTRAIPRPAAGGTARRRGGLAGSFAGGRLPAAALGLAGAVIVLVGVRLPWLSTFNQLLSQSGWGTRNGTILAVGAGAAGVLVLGQLLRPSPALRWLVALVGFGLTGFAGYLLIQLYATFARLDAMSFASKGPGLYVAAAGGLAVFATIFLPMPGVASPVAAPDVVESREVSSVRPWLLTRTGSRLRYPVAALAVVAGLAHVPVTPEHLVEAPYIGGLFIGLTVVCVLGATALLLADTPVVYALLGTLTLLAAVAYVLSRTVGLPLLRADVGNWLETLGVVAVLAEVGVALLGGLVVRRARSARRPASR
ncbi:MAG: hypothetical protein ACXVXB_10530 [Nocardioidaceae bacterium]